MFKPLHTLLTVKLDPKEGMTSGGIHLPDDYYDLFVTGTVVAVGPHISSDDDIPVEAGTRVVLVQQSQRDAGGNTRVAPFQTIQDGDKSYVLANISDVVGRLVDDPGKEKYVGGPSGDPSNAD